MRLITRTRYSTLGMKNIRTFILCSSAVLCGWLVASYTNEPKLGTTDKSANLEESTKAVSQAITTSKEVEESGKAKSDTAGPNEASQLAIVATMQEQ